eukprot:CAMPEP_0201482798 /NCGR_PEP_ID=MMETSP0151_2-20130828/7046_1 /ASSEMBLY_ACC=CAM_ASM_000257 /TAXON_ID=200890 /ORGANISM="Paramoeba atlantica, Strain 621/1 / CCAP 1560/9" /LENGTH=275 /DNA_ID=CAMNT_0047865651 /DNA_START=12 /DNA_END=836 /DNA_ORIENTATION=-
MDVAFHILKSFEVDNDHLENVSVRIGKWILRNQEKQDVLPKTRGSFLKCIKNMCTISYLQPNKIVETLQQLIDSNVILVEPRTGLITYLKTPAKKKEEEEEEEDEDEVVPVEYQADWEWICHPHNSPKHLTKLIHSLAFRTQKKEEACVESLVERLIEKGLLSITPPKGENIETPCSKIQFEFEHWDEFINHSNTDFAFKTQCERLDLELKVITWEKPPMEVKSSNSLKADGEATVFIFPMGPAPSKGGSFATNPLGAGRGGGGRGGSRGASRGG